VPAVVDQAVRRALAKAPADRFTTAGEFAQALQPSATSTAAASRPPVRPRPRVPTAVIALGLGFALGLGVLFAWRHSRAAGDAEPKGTKRIAVLPFENLGDSADAYFADGVTDAVRGKLMVLPGLEVIASNSSNEYRHTTKPPQEIARELGVDYLLVGKVRFAKAKDGASRVQVSPELIQGATAAGKWQEPFDAALTDVFQVQADIAGRVASALDVALGASQKQSLTERPTQNLAAYDAYLKGDAAQGLVAGDAPTLRSSISYYEQAVALDPSFADAWSKLARARAQFYYYITPNPGDAEAARNAAERAMTLAPRRPEGPLALGHYLYFARADHAGALAAFKAGLELSPDNAELLTLAALAEQSLGRWDAALAHLQRAAELDPRSAATQRRLAHSYLRLRRFPEALAAATRGLALAPTNLDLIENQAMICLAQGDLEGARRVTRTVPGEVEPTALVAFFGWYWDLVWVLDDAQQQLLLRLPLDAFSDDRGTMALARTQTYHLRGDDAKARIYADSARLGFEGTLKASPNDPQRHVLLGLALAYLGRKADAIREGQRGLALLPAGGDSYVSPYLQHQLARIYILTGEPDKAVDQLEALLQQPYFLTPAWLRIDPNFAPLEGNPRFERLAD
jgi:TolB-like protein/Flp pilus assembly protein TadD